MSEILKHIMNKDSFARDPYGNLAALDAWFEVQAQEIATEMNIDLSDMHWNVIYFLRSNYAQFGHQVSARKLLKALSEEYAELGGKRFLYKMFPGGPIRQGCEIAGIPAPADTADPAYGSLH